MLERMTSTIARIDHIKSHFRTPRVNGINNIAPHYSGEEPLVQKDLKPFLPENPVKPVQQKVKAQVSAVTSYDSMIESAASKYGVDPALVKAVVQAESGFDRTAVSGAGAIGLMQLMPGTARSLGVTDAFDPAQNIDGGVRYLRQQLDRFKSVDKALAAYNAGPGAVIKYGGIPPYRETQAYVKRVMSYRDAFLDG